MNVRKLESHEISLHRDVRLRALRDSPESFAERAEDIEQRPSSYWQDLTRSVTEPDRHVMFVAFDGDAVVGSIYGLRDRENDDWARIGGTWVAPSHRRRGLGRQLLQAVVSWACDHRFGRLALWAPSASAAALALYRQAGFKKTGRRQPLHNNSNQEAVELERDMPTQGSG